MVRQHEVERANTAPQLLTVLEVAQRQRIVVFVTVQVCRILSSI